MSLEGLGDFPNDSGSIEGLPDVREVESSPNNTLSDEAGADIKELPELELTLEKLDVGIKEAAIQANSAVSVANVFVGEKAAELKDSGADTSLLSIEIAELSKLEKELKSLEREEAASIPEFSTKVGGVEINVENDEALKAIERAADITYYTGEKANNLSEIDHLLLELRYTSNREFEDDGVYNQASSVITREARFFSETTALNISNGAYVEGKGYVVAEVTSPQSVQEAAEAERPTPAELAQAWGQLNNTSRGKLQEITAYLEDYRAVATGHFESYQTNMPTARKFELGRKSWFENADASNEPIAAATANDINAKKDEIISGLMEIGSQEIDARLVAEHILNTARWSGETGPDWEAGNNLVTTLETMQASDIETIAAAGRAFSSQIGKPLGVVLLFESSAAIGAAGVADAGIFSILRINSADFNQNNSYERMLTLIHEADHLGSSRKSKASRQEGEERAIILESAATLIEAQTYQELLNRGLYQNETRDRLIELGESLGEGGLERACHLIGRYHVLRPELTFSELLGLVTLENLLEHESPEAASGLSLTEADAARYFADLPVETVEVPATFSLGLATEDSGPAPAELLSGEEMTATELLGLRGNVEVYDRIRRLAVLLPTDSPQRNALIRRAQYLHYLFNGGVESFMASHPGENRIKLTPPEDFES